MSVKVGDKIAFWLALICTEIVLYLVIFAGISIVVYRVFKGFYVLPNAILSAIIEAFAIWRRYTQGVYAESYKEHISKEEKW